jgi:hypothetical protein
LRNYILKRTHRWPYGFQREFTIFELKEKLRKAGFRIVCSAGIDSLLPMKELLKEIPKPHFTAVAEPSGSPKNLFNETANNKVRILQKIRINSWKIETNTPYGVFCGREIGVCARKV